MYAGSRRRFSGMGTIAAGFVTLVLVLGALLTSELDRYSAVDSRAADPATGPALTPGAPDTTPSGAPGAPAASAAPGGRTNGADTSPSPRPSKTQPSGSSGAPVGDDANLAVLATVNQALTGLGCNKITLSRNLIAAAQAHLTTMVDTGYLALSMPDGTDPGERARAAGFTGSSVAEAIVIGADTPAQAVAAGVPTPTAADDALPIYVQVVGKSELKCGYSAVGADFRRDSRNVPISVIVLGT